MILELALRPGVVQRLTPAETRLVREKPVIGWFPDTLQSCDSMWLWERI